MRPGHWLAQSLARSRRSPRAMKWNTYSRGARSDADTLSPKINDPRRTVLDKVVEMFPARSVIERSQTRNDQTDQRYDAIKSRRDSLCHIVERSEQLADLRISRRRRKRSGANQ